MRKISIDTQICLVSSQPIPNLTAALDSRLRPKRVILCATSPMTTRAHQLKDVLERYGISVDIRPLSSSQRTFHMKQDFQELFKGLHGTCIGINVTGGQKPMSIQAFHSGYERDLPVFYVGSDNQLLWLHPVEELNFVLECNLNVQAYLEAYGYRVVSFRRPPFKGVAETLTNQLMAMAARTPGVFRVLNGIAMEAGKSSNLTSRLHIDIKQSPDVKEALGFLEQAGLLTVNYDSGDVRFADENSRSYAVGGWLEQYVYDVVNKHKAEWGVTDLCANVQVELKQGSHRVPNELDVVFLINNHLFIIECKTEKLGVEVSEDSKPAYMIYKLDSLRKVGGLYTRPMLISMVRFQSYDVERARVSDIELITGNDLKRLPELLHKWIMRPAKVR